MDSVTKKKLKAVLDKYGSEAIKEMQTRLRNGDKIASRNLYASLKYYVRISEDDAQLVFSMLNYGNYVESGRRKGATPPPVSAIRRWLQFRGLPEKYAFAISKSIGKRGIKPFPFFGRSIKRATTIVNKQIAQIFAEYFTSSIIQANKGGTKTQTTTFK